MQNLTRDAEPFGDRYGNQCYWVEGSILPTIPLCRCRPLGLCQDEERPTGHDIA